MDEVIDIDIVLFPNTALTHIIFIPLFVEYLITKLAFFR